MIDKSDNNQLSEQDITPLSQGKPPKARGAGFALFIASLALFFAAAGIAAGYKHWQRMSDRAKGNARKIEAIEAELAAKVDSPIVEKLDSEISERIDKHQAVAQQQLQDMAQMQTQTSRFAETVADQVERITSLQHHLQQSASPETGQEWQMAEVAYLLRLAERELQLFANHASALGALKAADKRLSEIAGVAYLPVRQQIARDISAVEAISVVDLAELSGKIDGLLQELHSVAPVTAESASVTTPDDISAMEDSPTEDTIQEKGDASLWAGYKQKTLDALNKAIVVRQIDNPLSATLSIEAQHQLSQLLQLRLENLRLLALQGNDRAYHAQIALLRTTLSDHFSAEQAAAWLSVLDELDALNLEPELPDIADSLRQLEQARQINMAQGQQ